MKNNPKLICLLILFTFLVVMASNVAAADAAETGKLTKVASNVAYDTEPVWSPNGKEILFAKDVENDENKSIQSIVRWFRRNGISVRYMLSRSLCMVP